MNSERLKRTFIAKSPLNALQLFPRPRHLHWHIGRRLHVCKYFFEGLAWVSGTESAWALTGRAVALCPGREKIFVSLSNASPPRKLLATERKRRWRSFQIGLEPSERGHGRPHKICCTTLLSGWSQVDFVVKTYKKHNSGHTLKSNVPFHATFQLSARCKMGYEYLAHIFLLH